MELLSSAINSKLVISSENCGVENTHTNDNYYNNIITVHVIDYLTYSSLQSSCPTPCKPCDGDVVFVL